MLRPRLSIVTTLALSFGSLVILAVGIAVWHLYTVAQSNTGQLIAATGQAVVTIVSQNLRHQLDPTENQLRALSRFILSDHRDIFEDGRIKDLLLGSLASDEQMDSLIYVRSDMRVMSASRTGDERDDYSIREITGESARTFGVYLTRAGDRRSAFWGTPFYSPQRKGTAIPLYLPVRRGTKIIGLLRATVTVAGLSRHIDEDLTGLKGTPFAMNADGFIIAHPAAKNDVQSAMGRLLRPSDLGDKVLAAFRFNDSSDVDVQSLYPKLPLNFRIQQVEVDGSDYFILYRPLPGYEFKEPGDTRNREWIIGTHVPDASINSFLDQVTRAAILGIGVMLLGVAMAILIGRRIARPITRLAAASEKIARLELGDGDPLPGGRLREVDVAVTAFNRMRAGLGWLSTYVPRSLLPMLVRTGSSDAFESKEREVTILFTDIVGFTSISQRLDAPALAAFLSRHFSLLEEAIAEEGGTIDKYIGDSVMAFWGAPALQPDHIERACRAALAITDKISADNERRRHKDLEPIRLRIGVETGRAIAGNIGAPSRINYTLVGDSVNLAQRFEQFAKTIDDGSSDAIVIIGSEVAAALPPDMQAEPLGYHLLPGRSEEMQLYRLLQRVNSAIPAAD
ncbi:adenylate/guanylate cyclase domain-containing protein [Dongia soli]|uniref:Adenylate/guanylate cyclase domain-containing protein n=1 Tax=Dongia soli TaxID=600628 RepID=A0ABU5E7N7_9PROT|nr:adenylate/guanylate cyclase domain-containing protein [Dongia soli]MDY0882194.1 adenylate/guanylate cyclase domain-containing protein [Dongia soli]